MLILLLALMTTTCLCQHREVELINRLNEFYGFDHNIFFLDPNVIRSERVTSTSWNWGILHENRSTPQTVYSFDYANTYQLPVVTAITSKNAFLIAVVGNLQFEDESQLLTQIREVRYLDTTVKFGLFLTNPLTSMHTADRLLQWSSQAEVFNIFCAFYLEDNDNGDVTFNVIRFNPFEKFDVIDVTTSDLSIENFFPDKLLNYHRKPFRLVSTMPRMLYNQDKFWKTIAEVVNASLQMVILSVKEIHSSAFKYGDAIASAILLHNVSSDVYPHDMSRIIMVVPHAKPCSSFVEFLKNGTWKRVLVYSIVVIATSTIILSAAGYLQNQKIKLFQSAVDVMNLLMNENGAIRYQRLRTAELCVVIPLTFTGLIVVNGILSLFQSFLTVPTYERQIDTLEELYNTSLTIATTKIAGEPRMISALESITNYGGWDKKVFGEAFGAKRSICNNSVAFPMLEDHARAITEVYQRLNLRPYHLIKGVTLERSLQAYRIRPDFPFFERINEIIHRLQSAGFLDLWYRSIFKRFTHSTLKNLEICSTDANEDEFPIPAVVWCGWIGSVIVFLCEIIWKKWTTNKTTKHMTTVCKYCCKR